MPTPALIMLIFAALAIAAAVGIVLRRCLPGTVSSDGAEGYLLSAALALIGLLIGFTLSMALNRYDSRRTALIAEANSLSTAWLRAGLVEGEAGATLRYDLKSYASLRAALSTESDTAKAEAATGRLQDQIWTDLEVALPSLPAPLGATLVTATTEMFDAASSRRWEREGRLPGLVLETLLFSAMIAAGIVGYVLGTQGLRHSVVAGLLFALLAIAVALILDLDRPWSGLVTVSQAPVEAAVAAMR